jgi:predicted transcriptional regulator
MTEIRDADKQKIRDFIAQNPGTSLMRIVEQMNLSVEKVFLCLQELEDAKTISVEKKEEGNCYYLDDRVPRIHQQKVTNMRNAIYALIAENPGLNLSKIAEYMNINISHLEYHLAYLERAGSIKMTKGDGYKRYYVTSVDISTDERKTLALLRQEFPFKIILLLLKHGTLQHKEILEHFQLSPSTLSYHLNKLLRDGIVDVASYGEDKGYTIKNKRAVLKFLGKYKFDKMIQSLSDSWSDIYYQL